MRSQTFKGHGIEAMFINVILALLPVFLILFAFQRPADEIALFRWPLTAELVLFIAYPTYLFFEVKHLILKDGIADDHSLISILVFGGQSLFGLILQVYVLVTILKLEILGSPSLGLVIVLSFLASFGACLGLTDLPLLYIALPKKVLLHSLIVFKSWRLVLVCFSTTLLLIFLTNLFI